MVEADGRTVHAVVEGQVQVAGVDALASGLVLGHRIHQWIPRLGVLYEQTANSGGKGAEVAGGVQQATSDGQGAEEGGTNLDAKDDELLRRHFLASPFMIAECQHLIPEKDEKRPELLQRSDGLPADDRNLHSTRHTDDIKQRVCLVDAGVEPPERHKQQRVNPDSVDHKDVAAPCQDHVDVGDTGEDAPWPRLRRPNRSDPQPKGRRNRGHRHRLVVELAAHRPHQVRGDDGHDAHRRDAGVGAPGNLVRQQASKQRSDGPEPRRDHAANVVDTHRCVHDLPLQNGQACEAIVRHGLDDLPQGPEYGIPGDLVREGGDAQHGLADPVGSHLHARVDGRPNGTANGVPRHVVVPLEELRQTVFAQVLRCTVVEPRVELVDDHAELLDRVHADVIGGIQEPQADEELHEQKGDDEG
mmetsp:Transcript_24548/g.70472  ORF Transcript_24548/g.70472 Transcript_24548/m.70472 type:complete len:415 (-) Transcript_24548:94-1338(-)